MSRYGAFADHVDGVCARWCRCYEKDRCTHAWRHFDVVCYGACRLPRDIRDMEMELHFEKGNLHATVSLRATEVALIYQDDDKNNSGHKIIAACKFLFAVKPMS